MGANWLWAVEEHREMMLGGSAESTICNLTPEIWEGGKTDIVGKGHGDCAWGRTARGMQHAAPPYGFLLIVYSGKLFLHFTLAKTAGMMAEEQKNRRRERSVRPREGNEADYHFNTDPHTHTLSEMSTKSLGSIEFNLKAGQCCQAPLSSRHGIVLLLLLQAGVFFC